MSMDAQVLDKLFDVIASRKGGDANSSYTAKLFSKGTEKITQKVGEEAVETVIAALAKENKDVVAESADLLYHLLVLWADKGVAPAEIWEELARREGVSGIDEKNSRPKE
ncbi:MAG: phosphoribosyl-ATP diphosphatase [Rhodospirillales bacterium]|nr:phosphoribosyl-ATP diphosphatase [Rhodospirillales bacterium]